MGRIRERFQLGEPDRASVWSAEIEELAPSSGAEIAAFLGPAEYFDHTSFLGCTELTSITFPQSVTHIGDEAFRGCSGLTSATFLAGLSRIGDSAFGGCTALVEITIPDSIHVPRTGLYSDAFEGCTALTSAVFLGGAPGLVDLGVFDNTAPDFTIYYRSTSTGFSSPTWNGYPAEMIDVSGIPAAPWLLGHGLPLETDLH